MSTPILYEQPLNEKIRIFLRLEHFFAEAQHFIEGSTLFDTQAAVETVLEMLAILERNDVRIDLVKELERQLSGLSKLLESPQVDKLRLNKTLEKITNNLQCLQRSPNKNILQDLRENELLTSIRHRSAISAGTCGFDLPAYHYLLNQPSFTRSQQLKRWLMDLMPLKEGINLLLTLLRESALFEKQIAEQGFYQKSLDTQTPCQLLRILLPEACHAYPEVSGNKHRVNIRFLGFTEQGRPKQIAENQAFDLCFCSI